MKKLYKKLLIKFMSTKFYSWMLKSIIPYIRFTTYYTSLKGKKYHKGYDLLEPCDIILCVDKRKLTTLLIGGDWSHAALCVSKDKKWEISEMTHNDYEKSTFFDICKTSDRVCILRCISFTPKYKTEMIVKCKQFVGANYDIGFSLGVKALYCSELIFESDFNRKLNISLEDIASLGRKYISPTGLYNAKNCTVIWDSDD